MTQFITVEDLKKQVQRLNVACIISYGPRPGKPGSIIRYGTKDSMLFVAETVDQIDQLIRNISKASVLSAA